MTAGVRLKRPDWCHFTQRLPRSRAHKQIKGAELPFEDEKFSYVALTRAPAAPHPARVLAQPDVTKVEVTAKLCTARGSVITKVPRRAKADYARARRWRWGDAVRKKAKRWSSRWCAAAHLQRGAADPGVPMTVASSFPAAKRASAAQDPVFRLNLSRLAPDQGDTHLVAACRAGLFSFMLPASVSHQELLAMSTGWIVLGVIVILVLFAFAAYNRLVALGQRVSQAFADIDVQLKQRHDLVPNLLETVKGYAAHERGTLDDVIKARNAAISAQGPGQVAAPKTS